MGLIKKYMNQTRKPEGVLGNLMITGMNTGHAAMAKWGSDYLRVSDPANVIDLGCGGGRNVKALSERYAEAKVTGLDYSELSVERARAFNSTLIGSGRCEIVQGDVSAIDLPDGSFDRVTTYHHDKKPWITVIAEKGEGDHRYRIEKDSVQEN